MLFFVMYDIESNKVRRTVATYLEKKGCQRIQKSVYLANLDSSVYEQIRSDLTEVQGMYENNDSIIFCQASVDELKSMDVIGHNLTSISCSRAGTPCSSERPGAALHPAANQSFPISDEVPGQKDIAHCRVIRTAAYRKRVPACLLELFRSEHL